MTEASLTGLWAYFDNIYCISLNERRDRRRAARSQFDKVGLTDRVEFVIVEKHPVDAEQGIFESHMACMRRGIAADAQTMLIFEDDVVFDRFGAAVLSQCIDFLSKTLSWEIFFLGCLVYRSRKTENSSVLKVRYRSLTHAYVVERGFAEMLVAMPWKKKPYDTLLGQVAKDAYAAHPAFAFQSNAPTDNKRLLMLDRFRRMCGGLSRIQKMNEWFHHNRLVIIAIHVLIIVFLLMLAARS
jgi:GR25 family glycosyltransferase involved in LPS biosynthesis